MRRTSTWARAALQSGGQVLALCLALSLGLAACGAGVQPRQDAAPATTAPRDGHGGGAGGAGGGDADAGGAGGGGGSEQGTAVSVLDASLDQTAAVDTGRYEMVIMYDTSSQPSFPLQQLRATGEFADGGHAVHLQMETTPDSGAGTMDETIVDGTLYVEAAGTCQSMDLTDLLGSASAGSSSMADPSAFLDQLRGIDGDVEDLGPLTVRDTPTTHYATTFSLRQAIDAAPQAQSEAFDQLYGSLPDSFLDADQHVDLFVDEGGLLRRAQVASPSAEIAGQTVPPYTTIMDYFDFGADVSVTAPTGCSAVASTFEPVGTQVN